MIHSVPQDCHWKDDKDRDKKVTVIILTMLFTPQISIKFPLLGTVCHKSTAIKLWDSKSKVQVCVCEEESGANSI